MFTRSSVDLVYHQGWQPIFVSNGTMCMSMNKYFAYTFSLRIQTAVGGVCKKKKRKKPLALNINNNKQSARYTISKWRSDWSRQVLASPKFSFVIPRLSSFLFLRSNPYHRLCNEDLRYFTVCNLSLRIIVPDAPEINMLAISRNNRPPIIVF